MKAELIEAFVGAARHVLANEMGEPVESQRPRLQGGPYRATDVTVIVGLARGIEGAVLLGISKDTALRYLSHVLKEDVPELDELAVSGIGELGNLIAGLAGTRLAELGYEVVIAPPTVLVAGDAVLSTLSVQRLIVPMSTPCGPLDLQMAARVQS